VGGGIRERVIVLRGDQQGDTFEAHITIDSYPTIARTRLWTTEPPVSGRMGAARFPETVRVARQVMGDDAEVAFGNPLAVAVH